eukprot:Skav202574  [mRNA]  locus=scaffold104:122635:124266:- [translate_table: standard]
MSEEAPGDRCQCDLGREPVCLGNTFEDSEVEGSDSEGSSEDMNQEHLSVFVSSKIFVVQMGVTRPEVLRVVPAHRAFERCFRALGDTDGDLYFKSERSDKISVFWSHSWHGSRWAKMLTLITIYNGLPAIVLGMFFACVMMALFCLQALPGFDRSAKWGPLFDHGPGVWGPFSCWASVVGLAVTSLSVFCWRSRTRVFFDRVCISESDPQLKAEAILSLAGLLRSSESMLILWDPTWSKRLWCLFELAAFLQSRKGKTDQKRQLVIIPTFVGPVRVAAFLVMAVGIIPATCVPMSGQTNSMVSIAVLVEVASLLVGYLLTSALRSYFRDLDAMKRQLGSISFDTAMCACCTMGHVNASGDPIMCDRLLVKECVDLWFGGVGEFEKIMRSEILEILVRDLSGQVISTKSIIAVCTPVMWGFMDLAASSFRFQGPIWGRNAAGLVVDGLVVWLVGMVAFKNWLLFVCKFARAKPRNQFLEVAKNSMVICIVSLPSVIVGILYASSTTFHTDGPGASGIFAVSVFCYVFLAWSLSMVIRTLTKEMR